MDIEISYFVLFYLPIYGKTVFCLLIVYRIRVTITHQAETSGKSAFKKFAKTEHNGCLNMFEQENCFKMYYTVQAGDFSNHFLMHNNAQRNQ